MTAYEFDERESDLPGITLVTLAGELDLTNAGELAERLGAVAAPHGLVVDLNRVAFVDSAALQGLFRVAQERGPEGIAYVLDSTASIATTLDIVGLAKAAIVVASTDDALGALAASTSP